MRAEGSARGTLRDYGAAILVAVLLALLIRSFLIEAYRIPSASMKPTLEAGDTIFVWKSAFGLRLPGARTPISGTRQPRHGEVVIFSPPSDPARDYIKRVVGMPGDVVELKRGQLWLNGRNVTQDHGASALCGQERLHGVAYGVCWEPPLLEDQAPVKVPPGSVFVLGDLRTRSSELGRRAGIGIIPMDAIKAKALLIWLSIEPRGSAAPASGWFSRIRFERMFRSIH
jgi:signal peptidase I